MFHQQSGAYSQDLRERVLRAADQGMPHQEIVRALGVSLATIGRYLKQRREQVLAPSLQPAQIVVMDNLSAYTGPKVRQAIQARGCHRLVFSLRLFPRSTGGIMNTQSFCSPL